MRYRAQVDKCWATRQFWPVDHSLGSPLTQGYGVLTRGADSRVRRSIGYGPHRDCAGGGVRLLGDLTCAIRIHNQASATVLGSAKTFGTLFTIAGDADAAPGDADAAQHLRNPATESQP